MSRVLPAEAGLRRVIGDGEAIPDGEVDGLAADDLLQLYRNLVLLRTYDERSLVYHRQGRIGTYAIFWGHEAMQAGSVFALEGRDWIFPSLPRVRDRLAPRDAGLDGALVVAGPPRRLVEPDRVQRRVDLRADRDADPARGGVRVGLGSEGRGPRGAHATSATVRPRKARSTRAPRSPA